MSRKFLCSCGKIRTQDHCHHCGESKTHYSKLKDDSTGNADEDSSNVVVTGPPGSGKTTHAFKIVGDGLVFDMDLILEAMNPIYKDYSSRPKEVVDVAKLIRSCLIEKAATSSKRFVFIVTHPIAARKVADSCRARMIEMVKGSATQVDKVKRVSDWRDEDKRASASERGYDYRWSQFSKFYRGRHPLCVDCLKGGRVKPSAEVHHIKKLSEFPDLKYEDSNLMALCGQCHKARTAKGE